MIDQAVAHMGDGLEASVRMLEARHPAAVVHRPAVLLGEVVTQGATGELLRGRTEVVHAFGVVVSVMGDEQEGSIVGHWAPNGNVWSTGDTVSVLMHLPTYPQAAIFQY